jgi:hypothetical protein
MQRVVGAVASVVIAATVNVATGFFTDHAAVAWWVSGCVLLIVAAAVQWWLPVTESATTGTRQTSSDNTVGGSLRQRAGGEAVQEASGNRVTGDLDQEQHE